jgi:hypothetical protein
LGDLMLKLNELEKKIGSSRIGILRK